MKKLKQWIFSIAFFTYGVPLLLLSLLLFLLMTAPLVGLACWMGLGESAAKDAPGLGKFFDVLGSAIDDSVDTFDSWMEG